ncbi:lipopolysaccharide transport periplasmic protein LptA [Candidatus Electronema sp. TJ]|uniref:lipopolysaccharide transport periplasmic protein LptA n=1 Tax=Candidatus Electronema sp. TJ TaxID=3401573 RepID=UPI003AA92C4A
MYFLSSSARRLLAAALTAAVMAVAGPAFSQGKEKNDAPINIEADRMVSQEAKNSVVFVGNVEASQGKVTIRADEMTVHYEESGAGGKKEADKSGTGKSAVKQLICIGNVEVTQEDWLGTGEKMEYFANERKVVLSGNAKASEGQNMVSSDIITYYLDEKRSVFEQDKAKPGRVKATIQQN